MAYNKSDRDGARRRPMRRRKKVCAFCADKEHDVIDYKDVNKRALTVAVKRARHVAIMPYTTD